MYASPSDFKLKSRKKIRRMRRKSNAAFQVKGSPLNTGDSFHQNLKGRAISAAVNPGRFPTN